MTEADLAQGRYEGDFDERKHGTPADWMWIAASQTWLSPQETQAYLKQAGNRQEGKAGVISHSGKHKNAKDKIDNGRCLVSCDWPTVPTEGKRAVVRLRKGADYSTRKPAFAARTQTLAHGGVQFTARIPSVPDESRIAREEARSLAEAAMKEFFPELWPRLGLKDVGERRRVTTEDGKEKEAVTGYFLSYNYVIDGVPIHGASVRVSILGDDIAAVMVRCPHWEEVIADENGGDAKVIKAKDAVVRALPDIKQRLSVEADWEIGAAALRYALAKPDKGQAESQQEERDEYRLVWWLAVRPDQSRSYKDVFLDAHTGDLADIVKME